MTQEVFKCSDCGKAHPVTDIELTFRRPDEIAALSSDEIEERCNYSDDIYILDDERYFIRGLIPLPVHDSGTPYCIGTWAEVSLEAFTRIYELWESDSQASEPAFDGQLANSIPSIPGSFGVMLKINLTGPTTRPSFIVNDAGSQLAQQQSMGISRHRAYEYTRLVTG